MFKIGCHIPIKQGIEKAPRLASALGCETFQIFTRSPQGGHAPELEPQVIKRFQDEVRKYYPPFNSPPKIGGEVGGVFVVHAPYFLNFGSSNNRIYYGSIAVVKQELERANSLEAKYVMAHLGSAKDVGIKTAIKQAQTGLKKILDEYKGKTQFLIEISAGAGEIIGDTFEELAEIMQPLKKFKTFGGICFDTQHAWASGYDITKPKEVFKEFNRIIGFKWLKAIHVNDSKSELGSHKDQHTHIGQGKIGEKGFEAFLKYLSRYQKTLSFPRQAHSASSSWPRGRGTFSQKGGRNEEETMLLILETEHDKVKEDIKILKSLRNKIYV